MALRTPRAWPLTSPQLIPVLPSIPSPAQVGSGLFPSLPASLVGIVLQDLSGLPLHTRGQAPRARWLEPRAPSSVCFPAGIPGAAGPLGSLWTGPGQHQGLCKAGVGTVGPCPGLPRGLGTPGTGTPLTLSLCASPAQSGAQGAGRSFIPLKGARTGVVPAAMGFGVCPITLLWVAAVPGQSQLCARGREPGSGAREEEDEGSSSPGEVLATGPLLSPLTPPPQRAKQCKG